MEARAVPAAQMAASPACYHLPLEGLLDLGAGADSAEGERHLEDRVVLEAAVPEAAGAGALAEPEGDSRKAAYLAVEAVEADGVAAGAEDGSDARR